MQARRACQVKIIAHTTSKHPEDKIAANKRKYAGSAYAKRKTTFLLCAITLYAS